MSRMCVKNLPKYASEGRLREFFSQKGEITDAKLMRTKDGKSRRFAFIGYRSEQEAEEAIKFFNNTFMDTCRITCEVARKIGDPNIPRPWSRYSVKDSSKTSVGTEDKGVGVMARSDSKIVGDINGAVKSSKSDSIPNDPQLQEFLQIMQPRAKSKLWANDTIAPSAFMDKECKQEKILPEDSKKELAQVMVGKMARTLLEKKAVGTTEVVSISDMDYFKSRVKKDWSDSEDDKEEVSDGEESQGLDVAGSEMVVKSQQQHVDNHCVEHSCGTTIEAEEVQQDHINQSEQTVNTGRLFIRNLPYTTSDDELLGLFSRYGDVLQVHIVVDKDSRRSKGIGYVQYAQAENAARAMEELDNSSFQGRLLHVMVAKPQNPSANRQEFNILLGDGDAGLSFKQKREEQRKASETNGDTRAWNSLFIRQDTVIENIARKYGVDKSDVLDKETDDLAVRVALAETHAIAETKKALRSAGVNVTALEELASRKDNIKRSNHVILVKNLPYGSSEGDLAKMFGNFGSIDKIILPSTKALALVVFLESVEARAAFKGLTYKRYMDTPLYLEWAPGDILSVEHAAEQGKPETSVSKDVHRVILQQTLEPTPEGEIDPDRVESRTVFVKNLNFKTSDECLKKHFMDSVNKGQTRSAKVKKHLKNGKHLSMGYGFVEFDSVETATTVCRDLQGTVLDGHALILQLCHAKKEDQSLNRGDKDKSSTKLIVRNVAFEATEKDIRQLFSSFGQIRRIRLPKRIDNHRGFAFVEFATKQETENAMQALSNTHLYGRHLVIERAKEGETLEELRERTAAHFVGSQKVVSEKKSRKRKRKNDAVDGGEDEFGEIGLR